MLLEEGGSIGESGVSVVGAERTKKDWGGAGKILVAMGVAWRTGG